jgi:CheY-like chemotaxis protein
MAPPDPKPVVLVVDDEPMVLGFMGRALDGAGYEVHAASSPLLALDLLSSMEIPPAVLVTDLRMTPLNGADLARLVVAKWPETRVLFVSAWDPRHPILPGPFLHKPFNAEKLVEAVGRLLAAPPPP